MKNTMFPNHTVELAVVAFALLPALLLFGGCLRNHQVGANETILSGNIEVTDAQLGFKVPGRVSARTVSEGENVTARQLIARLDDVEQKEQLDLSRAELARRRSPPPRPHCTARKPSGTGSGSTLSGNKIFAPKK